MGVSQSAATARMAIIAGLPTPTDAEIAEHTNLTIGSHTPICPYAGCSELFSLFDGGVDSTTFDGTEAHLADYNGSLTCPTCGESVAHTIPLTDPGASWKWEKA